MNKKLKEYADKQLASYQNDEFLRELKIKRGERKKPEIKISSRRLIALGCTLGVVIVTLAVALVCVFLIKPTNTGISDTPQTAIQGDPAKEPEIGKRYLDVNRKAVEGDLEELNNVLTSVSFKLDGNNYVVKKHIDEYYNETIYYYVSYNDEERAIQVYFTVSVNPDYTIEGTDTEFDKQAKVASLDMEYSESFKVEDDMYFFKESGRIKTDCETILITAEGIGLDEDSHFIEELNELIQVK